MKELILNNETHNLNIVKGKFNLVTSHYQSGKTTVLTNIAAKAVKDEKNIIYYGLDSSDEYMKKRVCSILDSKPLNDIKLTNMGFYDLKHPSNIVFNSTGLNDMIIGYDLELLGNVEFLFVDTLNLFDILGGTYNGFEDRLQAQIKFFNDFCEKSKITVVASLNLLKVHTFDLDRWKNLVSGNTLVADNQYVNFKIFDCNANITRDYGLVNSSMRLTCEIEERSTDRKIKPLFIANNGHSPEVNLNLDTKTFSIKGRAYPSYPENFWRPVLDWFKTLAESADSQPTDGIIVDMSLDFINSGSEKYVLEIVKTLKRIKLSAVRWYYDDDDEDIMDMGEDLFKATGISFLFVKNTYADSDIFD